jgi:hypothetical protein
MPFLKIITKSTKLTTIYCGELWIKQHFSAKIHQWKKKEQLHVYQNWAPTNTRRHHAKFSCYGYLASGIFTSLPKNLNIYVITLLSIKVWYWKWGCVRSRMLNQWQWCQVWQPQMFLLAPLPLIWIQIYKWIQFFTRNFIKHKWLLNTEDIDSQEWKSSKN